MTDPSKHGIPGDSGFDMRWLADRLDRIEGGVDDRFSKISDEITRSRHGLRELVDTIVLQVATLVTTTHEHGRRIAAHDDSAHRKGERIASLERWRSFLAGAVASVVVLFGVTVGVILWVLGR